MTDEVVVPQVGRVVERDGQRYWIEERAFFYEPEPMTFENVTTDADRRVGQIEAMISTQVRWFEVGSWHIGESL
jgi:hypothetical protein